MIKTCLLTLAVVVMISTASDRGSLVENNDVLAYSHFTYENGTTLYLYDTSRGEHREIYQTDGHIRFVFSADGRIAFSENNGELFIVDTAASNQVPFDLTREIEVRGYPLGWSPEGQYLAFATRQDEKRLLLYIWDGESIFDITPDTGAWTPEQYYVDWSNDGRLAVTVFFSFISPSDEGPSEIYLWDGNTMMNLSQNLEGEDRFPVWNKQNELAFLAITGERSRLYVWDGVSYRDGAPDAASYRQIAPGMTAYYSSPTWTTNGSIAFGVQLPTDQRSQIYRWDGESLVDISQNPDAHNGGETWNANGYWAFVTYFSPEQLIFIRDPDNNTLLETEGQYTPAWSSGNNLAFCRMERSESNLDWILSIWNEVTLTEIARGDEIYAQWQSGQQTVCSSG